MKDVKDFLDGLDHEKFLDQFLEIVEKQVVCSDIGNVCDIRLTSFGKCCVNCGLLPEFGEVVDD